MLYRKQVGNTPMHIAVINKNMEIVRLLDEYNADATIVNEAG